MARTYIVGDNRWQTFASSMNAILVCLPYSRLGRSDIHDFLVCNFKEEVGCLILYADTDPEFCMELALHLRLTVSLPGESYLCPIVFVTAIPHGSFLKHGFLSHIFLTEKIFICSAHELSENLPHYTPLIKETYRSDFLDKISIPRPEGNNHSLANQWGASRVYEIVTGKKIPQNSYHYFYDIQKELYYKYILQKTGISEETEASYSLPEIKNAYLKRILLVDDEAEKGWSKAIEKLFPSSSFYPCEDVIKEKVHCYEDFSDSAREKIESMEYDLILLDLRMGGIAEDRIVDPRKLSGYNILKQIKRLNKGNQVIMLTASNKAWNLKVLLDPCEGASGYFVKESPEYEFTTDFSLANLQSFMDDVQLCFDRSYLRKLYSFINGIKPGNDSFLLSLKTQFVMTFDMACQAKDSQGYSYAFIAMSQVAEVITSHLTEIVTTKEGKKELWLKDPSNNTLTQQCRKVETVRNGIIHRLSHDQYMISEDINKTFSQKDRMSCLYLQKWSNEDNGLLYLFGLLTQIRNAFIHKENKKTYNESQPIVGSTYAAHTDLMDPDLVFSEEIFRKYLIQASTEGFLFSKPASRLFTISDNIIRSSLGLKLFAEVLMKITDNII